MHRRHGRTRVIERFLQSIIRDRRLSAPGAVYLSGCVLIAMKLRVNYKYRYYYLSLMRCCRKLTPMIVFGSSLSLLNNEYYILLFFLKALYIEHGQIIRKRLKARAVLL